MTYAGQSPQGGQLWGCGAAREYAEEDEDDEQVEAEAPDYKGEVIAQLERLFEIRARYLHLPWGQPLRDSGLAEIDEIIEEVAAGD